MHVLWKGWGRSLNGDDLMSALIMCLFTVRSGWWWSNGWWWRRWLSAGGWWWWSVRWWWWSARFGRRRQPRSAPQQASQPGDGECSKTSDHRSVSEFFFFFFFFFLIRSIFVLPFRYQHCVIKWMLAMKLKFFFDTRFKQFSSLQIILITQSFVFISR